MRTAHDCAVKTISWTGNQYVTSKAVRKSNLSVNNICSRPKCWINQQFWNGNRFSLKIGEICTSTVVLSLPNNSNVQGLQVQKWNIFSCRCVQQCIIFLYLHMSLFRYLPRIETKVF
jgi:hypothetical protein